MRKLNKEQKNLVRKFCIQQEEGYTTHQLNVKYIELLNELELINDYETLNQDVDRLINDIRFSDNIDETIKKFK